MLLELENGESYKEPDSTTIESALRTLDGEGNDYAILSQADEVYVQAAGSPETGFILEYRAGSADAHFQSLRDDLALEKVVRTFVQYAAGDPSWKAAFEWKPLAAGELSGRRGWLVALVIFALVVAILLLLRFLGQ